MKSIETEGKTVEQAIELGLYKLGAKREDVKITVLKQASLFDKALVRISLNSTSEEEGKVKALVEDFINHMGLNLEVYVEEREEDFFVNISGEDSALFIGKRGESIEEFQTLVNCIYNKNKPRDEAKRVSIDSNNYIVKRIETLTNLAKRTAGKVIRERKDFKFEPMNAYERRIIHSALSDNDRVSTESFGNEPNRCIVVKYKNAQPRPTQIDEEVELPKSVINETEQDTLLDEELRPNND